MSLGLENKTNYEICGEILTSFDKKQRIYTLKCVFCSQFNESLTKFIEHIEHQHEELIVPLGKLFEKQEGANKNCNTKSKNMLICEQLQWKTKSFSVDYDHQSNDDPLQDPPFILDTKADKTTKLNFEVKECGSYENIYDDKLDVSSIENANDKTFEDDNENINEFNDNQVGVSPTPYKNQGDVAIINFKSNEKQLSNIPTNAKAMLPIAQLSDEQNVQVIEIYKCFPCLWNTEHIGYRFKNQRQNAVEKMLKTINEKIKLKLTTEELQKKLYSIRRACSQEKHRQIDCARLGISYEPIHKFAKDISFLSEHVGPFKCLYCMKMFNSVDQYKVHLSTHDGSLPFTCPICKRGFMRAGNCTIHIRRHTRDYDFECEICKKRFATTTDLAVHKRYHTGEKPYFCDTCGKAFRTWSFFDRHMRRHQKRPQHICDLCKKTFYEKKKLDEHMKAHFNVRDQVCNICGKTFTSTKYLRQHKQIHSERKKYACKICTKEFAQYAGLSGHMKCHGTTLSSKKIVD